MDEGDPVAVAVEVGNDLAASAEGFRRFRWRWVALFLDLFSQVSIADPSQEAALVETLTDLEGRTSNDLGRRAHGIASGKD